jgi:hypothetical protein
VAQDSDWKVSRWWLVIFIWWMPTHVQAVTGQLAWMLLLPTTFAWRAARRQRWLVCGNWIGLLIAIKPFLAPLLAWLAWRGQWRSCVRAARVLAGSIVLGIVVFGGDEYGRWLWSVRSVDWYAGAFNASLWGLGLRLLRGSFEFRPLVALHDGATIFVYAGVLAVIVATWAACKRSSDIDRQWNVVVAASLLISPLGWVYYGTLLLPAWRGQWPGLLATGCWLIPTPLIVVGQPSPIATLLWGSAPFWGLALAFVQMVKQHRSPVVADTAPASNSTTLEAAR